MTILTKILILGTLIGGSQTLAQMDASKNNAALKHPHTVNEGPAKAGANSFSQAQAREHIAASGFTAVSSLTKDAHGMWRGTAHKNGRTYHVALDFTGNVTTHR